jgi:hypothetical protein
MARLVDAPAENNAYWIPDRSAVSTSSTMTLRFAHATLLPADRADANARTFDVSIPRSARSFNITPPTCPVAPTTAMEGFDFVITLTLYF